MEKIQSLLKDIEQKKQIQILYACETGSRAWGFPSPDSDYDIRFIYRHQKDWYLSLNKQKDSIEQMIGHEWDITGWELRKSLVMLKKSNAALIERFQSPVVYMDTDNYGGKFLELIKAYYSPTAVFYHHYALAKKFWEDLKDEPIIKLKSFFYLVRSLLSCNYIVHNNDVVPMHIEGLMQNIPVTIHQLLQELMVLKSGVGEQYTHPASTVLNSWIVEVWAFLETKKNALAVNDTGYTQLNNFFRTSIG